MVKNLAVSLLAVATALGAAGESSATPAKRTPTALYHALLTTPFTPTQVVGRFTGPSVTNETPSTTNLGHHAIGAVEVNFAKGGGTITYTIFRTARDARGAWYDDNDTQTAMDTFGFHARLRVVGLNNQLAFVYVGTGACDASGPCVSVAEAVVGTTRIDVSVTVQSTHSNYDESDTSSLTRAAYRHLLALS
jgi:hypothetical protein